MGFPSSSAGKESTCNAGDPSSIPGEGKGYPLQYFGLENSMDCIVHVVSKSQTLLSDFHYKLYVDFLLCERLVPLPPVLLRSQLYLSLMLFYFFLL